MALVPACGGEGPFAADFDSHLDRDAVVDDLAPADRLALCEAIATYAQLAVSERALDVAMCRIGAVLGHAPDVNACEAARAPCGEVGLLDAEPPDTTFCEGAVATPCATTVGELEDCYSATRVILSHALETVACTMGPVEAGALLLPAPECAAPMGACPAYFPNAPQGTLAP